MWATIFSVFMQTYEPELIDAPYPLAGTGQYTWDIPTMQSIGLTCKAFYSIVACVLGDWQDIRDMAQLKERGRQERARIRGATTAVLPRTLSVIPETMIVRDSLDPKPHPSFAKVQYLMIWKPIESSVLQMSCTDFIERFAKIVGPQVDEIFIIPSEQPGWFYGDIATISESFPRLRTLHISDLRYKKPLFVADPADTVSSDPEDDEDDGYAGRLELSQLQWLGLGDVAYLTEDGGAKDTTGFELIVKDLVGLYRSRLKRIDVLQYIGKLDRFFTEYSHSLEIVCFSLTALVFYDRSIASCTELNTLYVIVDCGPVPFKLVHRSLQTISFYLPAILLTGITPPSNMPAILNNLVTCLSRSDLRSLQTVYLRSEVPLTSSFLFNIRQLLKDPKFKLVYTEEFR